jgi:hypothetical protein
MAWVNFTRYCSGRFWRVRQLNRTLLVRLWAEKRQQFGLKGWQQRESVVIGRW